MLREHPKQRRTKQDASRLRLALRLAHFEPITLEQIRVRRPAALKPRAAVMVPASTRSNSSSKMSLCAWHSCELMIQYKTGQSQSKSKPNQHHSSCGSRGEMALSPVRTVRVHRTIFHVMGTCRMLARYFS